MLKISTFADIDNSSLDLSVKIYLTLYLTHLISVYHTIQIQDFASLIYLENSDDCYDYSGMGLPKQLKKTPFEYCEVINLKNSHGDIKLLHSCYILNNDFAIDVFGYENIFDDKTLQTMLDNLIE